MLIQLDKLDARIPEWNLTQLTKRNCPFCNSNNNEILSRPDNLTLTYCENCGCWYICSLPNTQSILEFYNGYFNNHRPSELNHEKATQLISNIKRSIKNDWQIQTLSKLLNGLEGKRVLEVGCGLCRFLLAAKVEGADVIGFDLSPEACKFAKEQLGITVNCSAFESSLSMIDNVDAVIMRDFLEHPIDPLSVIEAAHSILKPEGVLLLHTPNGGDAGKTVDSGQKWVGFRVDLEHLQYLSPKTINWLSKRFNMSIERLIVSGFPGLKNINKPPSHKLKSISVKSVLKKSQFLYNLFNILRQFRVDKKYRFQDPRLGSYHLFAVLRKQ